jgi:hypothetical protein
MPQQKGRRSNNKKKKGRSGHGNGNGTTMRANNVGASLSASSAPLSDADYLQGSQRPSAYDNNNNNNSSNDYQGRRASQKTMKRFTPDTRVPRSASLTT